MMASIWRPKEGMEVHDIGGYRFSFVFYHVMDMRKVLEGGPWSFEQNMLVYSQLKEAEDPHLMALNEMDIWVQVHDIPKGFISENILRSVGTYIGKYVKADPANFEGVWKSYVRIRHTERECGIVYDNPEKEIVRAYGVWLRAQIRNNKKYLGARWLRTTEGGRWTGHGGVEENQATNSKATNVARFEKVEGIMREKGGDNGAVVLTPRKKIEQVCKSIHYAGWYALKSDRHGGGLALLWKNDGGVEVKSSSQNFIDFEVSCEQVGRWRYTGFYGCPEHQRRRESWQMIRNLGTQSQLPWCIIGDFNDIMYEHEKKGGRKCDNRVLEGFKEAVFDSNLIDIGFMGSEFTWEKSRGSSTWVQERLDRALATQQWCTMFPQATVQVLDKVSTSDHMPIFLEVNRQMLLGRKGLNLRICGLKKNSVISSIKKAGSKLGGEILSKR
ncbi:hypothetical protein AgCh_009020 [Apium graveolens]